MKNKNLPDTLSLFIWHFLKLYKLPVFICGFLSVISGVWGPFNSILVKKIINLLPTVVDHNISILIMPASLIILNFLIFDNLTWRGVNYIWAKYVPIIQNKIIGKILQYILSHSNEFYQNTLYGKISKQITNLIDGITKIITSIVASFLKTTFLLLVVFTTAYYVNPIFFYILIIWFIVFSVFSFIMSKKIIILFDKLYLEESIIAGELVDSLTNHDNIRIFGGKLHEHSRMKQFFNNQQKAYTKTHIYSNFISCIQGGLIVIMMGFSSFSLVFLYSKNLVTMGDFALILGLSMEIGHSIWHTMSEVDEFNKAIGKCNQSLFSIMVPLEILDKPNATSLICKKGEIVFKNVSFHYKNKKPFFKNQSIIIKPGEKVALLGYPESGKSTFINLILRFYDITKGEILIDGMNIKDVTQDSLRENIAMIPQDPSLFQRSLIENIRYGKIDASEVEIIEAAKKAHAHEFIKKLPNGYNSLIGEGKIKLSLDQRQRIAIARAILKDAPIIILHESISQLDSITEKLIEESLSKLIKNKTTIVIAHKLSTVLKMDRILVFDNGVIVEDGKHNELLKKKGLYKKLWDSQIGGFLNNGTKED